MSVLAVVLDAAERELLWRWAREGELPVLGRMLRDGASAQLESAGWLMPESAWPAITTGSGPGAHGLYNWRPIAPGTHRRTRQPRATARKAIWDLLRDERPQARAVVLDAPFSTPLGDDRVTELLGWGERGAVHRDSWPPGLMADVVSRHGAFPVWTEEDYVRRPLEERRLVRALEDAVERRTTILLELLAAGEWDLGFACFAELHDGGHALYRYVDPGGQRRARFGREALLRLYRAADTALGRLREAIGDEADLVVCSLKGFRPNTNGVSLLPQVLEGLGYQVPRPVTGGARRIELARGLVRALAPRPLRRRIFGRMSTAERDGILERLWLESVDWGRSRAFGEPDFGSAFVRANVRGREPEGIVEPGAEHRELLAEIAHELSLLTHAGTGAPAVERVVPLAEAAPGPNTALLPDLVVAWTREVMLDAVHHPRLGTLRESMKDVPASEHTGEAFVIGSGPSFRPGVTGAPADLADVAATLLHLAGAALPSDMEGRTLTGLLAPSVPPERRRDVDWALDPWALSG